MASGFRIITLLCICFAATNSYGQNDAANSDFRNSQMSSDRVLNAWKKYNNILQNTFAAGNLQWPATDIYLRAFKLQNEMELWARDNANQEYKLVKIYRICAISGTAGPKRKQGDKQVPEGYYFIDDFNPKSDYHLSMQLNYPNYSDMMQGKSNLGGDIYIHGGCLTVGCLPMEDEGIREIYTLCLNAKFNGQEYIPVHIFPTRMGKTGMAYLQKAGAGNANKQQFWNVLKNSYDYFEQYHKLLPVVYTQDGNYLN
jgi:murein L,D-transpeptidase YafK